VVLFSVGAVLLADNLGFELPFRLWNAWPLVVVAIGLVKLLWPSDADDRRSGFWTLVGGLYCWISVWRLFGLHWGTAWPIFLVAQGVMIVIDGASCRSAAGRSEVDDVR
jgi:hypothetical protein